jgi:glycosyltransferase involved in cell wall biosynthesis
MVTGVYHPEVSGAASQCRQLVKALREKVCFTVLTTTRNSNLPSRSQVDAVDVSRVLLRRGKSRSYCNTILKLTTFFLPRRKDIQIVHLHGFSLKSAFLMALSRMFQKKVLIKMTSTGHDDPVAMRKRGFLLNYFFSKADAYVGMSPLFERLYSQSQLPLDRLKQIPNGVEIDRFHPITAEKKKTLRDQLGLPREMKSILFVGHFSREKCPDILLEAWKQSVAETFSDTGLIFVGSTDPYHYEVDAELVRDIRHLAEPYLDERIFFFERTHEIEKVYQAADFFVFPSLREGMPNALLEAMSSGLPVIVSKLEGVTDWIVTDGIDGLLVQPGDGDDLGRAIKGILGDDVLADSLGREARRTVLERFSMKKVAEQYRELYKEVIPST